MRRHLVIISGAWLILGLCSNGWAQVGGPPASHSSNGLESAVNDDETNFDDETDLKEATEAAGKLDDSDFLIVFRLSPEALRSFLFKEVNHRGPVNRIIMGTHSTGESFTSGNVVVEMLPNSGSADPAFLVRLTGTTRSSTVGRNGPAIIRSRTNSHFVCERTIRFDGESGFVPLRSQVKANPEIHYEDFSSDRGGIRGRLIARTASRRAEESRARATQIVRQIQEEELQKIFNSRLNENIASLNRKIQLARFMAPLLGQPTQLRMAAVAAPEGLKIGFAPADSSNSLPELPQRTLNDAPIEVWLRVNSIAERPRQVVNAARLAMGAWETINPIQEISVSVRETAQPQPLNIQSTLLRGWIRFGIGQEVDPRT